MIKKLLLPLILILILFLCLNFDNSPFVKVYASPEDVYGNDINFVEVWQFNGSDWILVANFTSSGGSARIHDGWKVKFNVGIKLNSSLASSTTEAIDYTRVLMNITYDTTFIWQNVELNNTSCELIGNFYYLIETGNWTTNLPRQGVTYDVSIRYEAYY